MIAVWYSPAGVPFEQSEGVDRSLTRYGGTAASAHGSPTNFRWLRSAWNQFGQHGQVTALLQGWIDNAIELAHELDLAVKDTASVFAAALDRWGDEADAHCIGNYCAIAQLANGSLRLSRSPWDAPPLYYHANHERVVASPLHRVLFAAGAPRELDYDRIIDELAYDWRDGDEAGWYRDILQVPLGCALTFGPGGRKLDRWYDVDELPPVRLARDDDYPQATLALLDEAAGKALAVCEQPAMALSGGLDSPLVASSMTKILPDGKRLAAVTFVPHPAWDGTEPAGTFGSELEAVRNFAAHNGRIDCHLAAPEQGGFDHRAREMFQAMDVFAPGLANVGMFHGVWAKARELGSDMLLTADLGNLTISDAGMWAFVEYARSGQWGELCRLLANRPHDSRSFLRKLGALTLLPQLPAALRKALRGFVHPERRDMTGLFTLLSPSVRAEQRERGQLRGTRQAWDDFIFPCSRVEANRLYAALPNGLAADVNLALEQLYGLGRRDVTAYRPLVEFCLGLPTGQFAARGQQRRLARRMAKGRLPERQRLETRQGQHNVDWHARMTPRRAELLAYAETMRGHPWLAQIADIDRMQEMLEQWPDTPDWSWERGYPRMLGLPRIALAAQFISYVEGRNDL